MHVGAAASDDGRGWNVAYAKEETVEGIVDALWRGRFYSSTGVVIEHITVEGLHVEIETSKAARIVALRDGAQRFAVVDGASISVDAPVDASYVRFGCWGTGESFAWTQPFFVTP